MTIRIENRNGQLVGVDSNGNEVPIELGDVVSDSVTTDKLNNIAYVNEYAESGSGTGSDPYVNGFQAAFEDIYNNSETGLGTIYFPAGVYKINKVPNIAAYAVDRNDVSGSIVDEPWTVSAIRGDGLFETVIKLGDSVNESLFHVDLGASDSNVPTNETLGNVVFENLSLYGNKSNNTSGKAIEFSNAGSGRLLFNIFINNLSVRFTQDQAIDIGGPCKRAFVTNITLDRAEKELLRVRSGPHFFSNIQLNHNQSNPALWVNGNKNVFSNLDLQANKDKFLYCTGSHNRFNNVQVRVNTNFTKDYPLHFRGSSSSNILTNLYAALDNNADHGMRIGGNDNAIGNYRVTNYTVSPIDIQGSQIVVDGTITDSYTGDGTTGRTINLPFRPNGIMVEESGGDIEMLVRGMSRAVLSGSSMSGELSLAVDGFTVGDNSADADPNTDTETYQYRAW